MARKRKFQPTRNGQFIGKHAPYNTREEAQAEIERDKERTAKSLADGWIDTADGIWWDIQEA